MNPITVSELRDRLMDFPGEAVVYIYCGQDGIKVQAEWNPYNHGEPGSKTIMEMVIPMTGGGPAT